MAKLRNQVVGVGTYRQYVGDWAGDNYSFGYRSSKAKFGALGCTPTSITNILNWTMRVPISDAPPAPTPADTNFKRPNFWFAFERTVFKDLTESGIVLGTKYILTTKCVEVQRMSNPIERKTWAGEQLLTSIRSSIRRDHPVLIGLCGGPSHTRHSVVGVGIDENNRIMVIDPWTTNNMLNADKSDNNDHDPKAAFADLDLIMREVGAQPPKKGGYTHLDMAFEASRQLTSYIEDQEKADQERRNHNYWIK